MEVIENRNAVKVIPKNKLKSAEITATRIMRVLSIHSDFKILDVGCEGNL